MEHDQLNSIASSLFQAIPDSVWKDKSLDQIESSIQSIVNHLASTLLDQFVSPARVNQIEQQISSGQIVCDQCQSQFQLHKQNQQIHPKTIFGEQITFSRSQYYCPHCDTYSYVADQVVGLINHRMTPRLAIVAALCGASWSYSVASAFLDFLLGVDLCTKTIHNLTVDQELTPEPLAADPLDNPPGVVTMDGVLVRGQQKGQWLEMKVASFFSNVVEVSDTRKEVMDASFVASAVEQWKDFVPDVTEEAMRRGLDCTEAVEFISDGASGIWSLQEMVFPYARVRLDLYHAKGKIYERTTQAYRYNAAKGEHQEVLIGELEKGEVDEAIEYLRKHMPRKASKKEAAQKLIGYLNRHKQHIPNYKEVKAEGGSVSSGLVEKANDLIVVRRMKEGIMHWSREGAGPVIKRRVVFINKHARNRTGPYDLAFCRASVQ